VKILYAVAEFEREVIRDRVDAGWPQLRPRELSLDDRQR
jgi:DNA invertase Pin-like site-specific DNA recombinase